MMVDPLRQSRRNVPRSNVQCDAANGELELSKGNIIQVPKSNILLQIIDLIGRGQFGCVYNVINMSDNRNYALKVINSSAECIQSGMSEINTFKEIIEKGNREGLNYIVGYYGSFVFQGHICIILEKLSLSLLDVLRQRKNRGLPLRLVRVILQDLVKALSVFDELDLMHLDIKPENILMRSNKSVHVKLADIGSAEHVGETKCKYSITRYYRPPEIVLGCGMSKKADIWSLGTLIAELYLGHVLFNASDENQLLVLIEKILNKKIPIELIDKSPFASKFFDKEKNLLVSSENSELTTANTIEEIIENADLPCNFSEADLDKERKMRKPFADLLKNMLEPNPEKRFTLKDVIAHPFLADSV